MIIDLKELGREQFIELLNRIFRTEKSESLELKLPNLSNLDNINV